MDEVLALRGGLAYGEDRFLSGTTAMAASRPAPLSLDAFLRDAGRRAQMMAQFAVRDREAALDIVQEAMISLATRYADRDPASWGPLFQVILQSRIMDHHRRETRRKKWMTWLNPPPDEPDEDPWQNIPETASSDPVELLGRADDMDTVMVAVEKLPLRQQQAFLMRAWEGLDTAQTAAAMGCSEGSVKTHYFRALAAIRQQLNDSNTPAGEDLP
jgi:RNA polymerase sigma-70 factor (ECF subfamily)